MKDFWRVQAEGSEGATAVLFESTVLSLKSQETFSGAVVRRRVHRLLAKVWRVLRL